MGWVQDTAQIVVPALTAGGGAWYGARLKFRQERKAELARVLDEAAQVLERADQKRGGAYSMFIQDGANTTQPGIEAIQAFRSELSTAAQLRASIALSEPATSSVHENFSTALEALGE